MATNPNPDIEILVGLDGGDSIASGSGKLIKDQLVSIFDQIKQTKQFEITLNQKFIQDQVSNAIKNMPAVELKVKPKIVGGGGNGGGGGRGGGGGSSYQAEVNKVARESAQANRYKVRVFDVASTTKEAQAVAKQVKDIEQTTNASIKSISQTYKRSEADVRADAKKTAVYVKSVRDQSIAGGAVEDKYNALKSTLKSVRYEAAKTKSEIEQSLSAKTRNTPQFGQYLASFNQIEQQYQAIERTMFNPLKSSGDQLQQLRDLIALYKSLSSVIVSVKGIESGYHKDSSSQLNNIIALVVQKKKLETTRLKLDPNSEQWKVIGDILKQIQPILGKSIQQYAQLTNQSVKSAKAQINGMREVRDAANQYNVKRASTKDAYRSAQASNQSKQYDNLVDLYVRRRNLQTERLRYDRGSADWDAVSQKLQLVNAEIGKTQNQYAKLTNQSFAAVTAQVNGATKVKEATIQLNRQINANKEAYQKSQAAMVASQQKTYDTQIQKLSQIGDAAVQTHATLSKSMLGDTKNNAVFTNYENLFNLLEQMRSQQSSVKFDPLNASQQIQDVKALIDMYDDLTAHIKAVKDTNIGNKASLQDMADMKAKIYEYRTKQSGYAQGTVQYDFYDKLINDPASGMRKSLNDAIDAYHKLNGVSKDSIRAQILGFDNVKKAAERFRSTLAKSEDAYNSQKKKLSELKTSFVNITHAAASKQYATNPAVAQQYAEYAALRREFAIRSSALLNGSFDKNNAGAQQQELREVIALYGQMEKALAKVEQAKKKDSSATLAMRKTASRVYEFYQQIKDTAPLDFQQRVLNLFNEATSSNVTRTAKAITTDLEGLKNEAYKSGYAVETFGQKLVRVFKQKFGYAVMGALTMQLRKAIRQMYSNVKDMDDAMTQLRIVTNETAGAYERFATNAAKSAKTIGASVSDIMKSSETYARLGYSLDESLSLSTTTAQLANVAATDANTATTFMTAILKGFNKTASDAEGIGDILTLVGKKYAISAEELGAALERGGASMYAANNTLEESVALLAAGNAAVQNAETVGTAMKTVTMRIRGSSADDLEAAGLAADNLCESTSKLRKEIKALSGVDIMLSPTEYKSTYQIMLEIADVWDKLTDVNQATLLEKLGGKRNAQVLASILSNVDDLKGAYADAQNAAGTMAESTNKYMDSISGKSRQVAASYQELSSRILDSDFLKSALNLVYKILDALNEFDEATNGAASAALGFTLAVTAVFIAVETLHKVLSIKAITTWASNLAAGFSQIGSVLASGSITELISLVQLMPGLAVAAAAAIAMIGYAAYKAYQEAHPSLEDLKADLEELQKSADDTKEQLQTTAKRIEELQTLANGGKITLTEQDELTRLKEENRLLQQQYAIQKAILEQKQAAVTNAARDQANAFLADGTDTYDGVVGAVTGHVNSGREQVEEDLQTYQSAVEKIKAEYDNARKEGREVNKDLIDQQTRIRNQAGANLQAQAEEISNIIKDLDPDKDAVLIKDLQGVLDHIQVAVGGATAGGNIINATLNSRYYENATVKLKELANAGTLTKESIEALNDPLVNELIAYLTELGLFSWDNIESLAAQLRDVGDAAPTLSQTLSGVSDQLKAMTDRYDLLYDAQKEFNQSGAIASDTLSSIVEKYPELASNVGLYIAGMKSGKELLADISKAYQDDVSAYKRSLAEKLSASPEFYNNLSSKQKTYIDDLAESYKVDLKNFKDLETAKLQFQAGIIQKLAANYSQYTGASVDMLYNNQQRLILQIGREKNAWKKAELQGELTQVTQSIQAILKFQNELDAIALDGVKYDPSKYSPSKIKDDGKTGTDKYKQAIEKDIKILQHKREMDLITDEEYYDQLEEIEKRYYVDREKYKEEIWDLDQEIFNGRRDILSDWISDQEKIAEGFNIGGDLNAQKKVYEDILNEVEKMIDSAIKYGLDENSDYVQELRDQYHKTCQDILNMVQDAYDSFKSYADDFEMWDSFDFTRLEYLEKNLQEIQKLYEDGLLGWKEYVEAYNKVAKEIYDTKKDSIETIIDLTMEMIEQEAQDEIDALDEQIDKLNEIIDLKKKLLQDTKDEKDHEKQVAEAVAEIAKLQSKIAQLSLDDSREAIARRAELEEQLAEKQKELADLQGDYQLDKTLDVLDETKEAKEDETEAEKKAIEKSIDSWVKKYKLAIDRIDNDWDNLYDDLNDYMAEHRDSIDGPDSLKTAWENVDQMVRQTGQDIESIYNNIGNIGINPEDPQSILDAMQRNSELAKKNGSSQYNGRNLHEENNKLAADYEKATGVHLTYDDTKGWLLPDGTPAYSTSGSSTSSSKGNASSGSSSSNTAGAAYRATIAEYGEPPEENLKIGSSGDGVKWLQYYLKQQDYFPYAVDGTFYTRTEEALKKFQRKAGLDDDGKYGPKTRAVLKKYHTGGIVDRTGAINDKEVLAILQSGELILDDQKKANLREIFDRLRSTLSTLTRTNLFNTYGHRPIPAGAQAGNIFAPQVSVKIEHSGKMTDRDAKRYGEIAADATLEKLRAAFNKRGVS